MKVAISGASGLVGSGLGHALTQRGDDVRPLVRGRDWAWGPSGDYAQADALAGMDAVVHLAGENVGSGRWSRRRMEAILDSRVRGTRVIAQTLADLPVERRPRTLLCASATGYYGDRGDEVLTEASPAGQGFLAEVCRQWEQAAEPARQAGVRVVHARLGMVLSSQGGAFKRILPIFKLGLGGAVGQGRQYWSWITLHDAVRALVHLLDHDTLAGPANVVTFDAVSNRQFTRALAKAVHRSAWLPAPGFALRLVFGAMADELLLASVRVKPEALDEADFSFDHPTLPNALRHVLHEEERTGNGFS